MRLEPFYLLHHRRLIVRLLLFNDTLLYVINKEIPTVRSLYVCTKFKPIQVT